MAVLNSFLPVEWRIRPSKKLPGVGGGWSGLELTDTLSKLLIRLVLSNRLSEVLELRKIY